MSEAQVETYIELAEDGTVSARMAKVCRVVDRIGPCTTSDICDYLFPGKFLPVKDSGQYSQEVISPVSLAYLKGYLDIVGIRKDPNKRGRGKSLYVFVRDPSKRTPRHTKNELLQERIKELQGILKFKEKEVAELWVVIEQLETVIKKRKGLTATV